MFLATRATSELELKCPTVQRETYRRCVRHVNKQCREITRSLVSSLESQRHDVITLTEIKQKFDNSKMNIVDDNISYVIPLDEIDLNYYYGKDYFSNDPMPLWNTNSSIYYELKIFAQRKSQLNQTRINGTDEYFTENPKYQCHICNSSVPIVYKKQHINSQKHKTFLKIIETVMVRARHCLVQTQDDNHQLKPMQHSYYCEPCSTEVKIINREDHDMSKDHFKSLMHVKFLNDLLKIYIDKEHLEKVDFEYMTNDPANYAQNGNCKQHECDADDLNENDEINKFLDLMQNLDDNDDAQNLCNESENETTSPSSLTDIEVIAGKETTDTKTTTSNGIQLKVTNLKEYIDMLLSNENAQISNKITVIGDRLNIEAVDKSIVTVSEDNFHSFMRDADGKVTFCKVCDVSIKDKNSHVLTPEHMRRVMAPIQDMHGIRQGYCFVNLMNYTYCPMPLTKSPRHERNGNVFAVKAQTWVPQPNLVPHSEIWSKA
ncbi:hypothetical protein evm_007833 [Chilo suppressalis]|nr:hypothetical protein evm_007833 [Chilo suppressalis]